MKTMKSNFILGCDTYKYDHGSLLKDGVVYLESNGVPRKPNGDINKVVMDGMQIFVQQLADMRITMADIDEAEIEVTEQGYMFDRNRWEYIIEHFDGVIPLTIRALPEGTVVPVGNPVYRVFNDINHPVLNFLPSYIETEIQRAIWFPLTVASNVRAIKQLLVETMMRHANHINVDYHLHNFGDRGAADEFAAILASMAHAKFFKGSDCAAANRNIKYWYGDAKSFMTSVSATEHSVSCSNADADKRDDFGIVVKTLRLLERKIEHKEKTGKGIPIVSMVIDTYDPYKFTREYICKRMKNTIIELGKRGGKVVLRPDSGVPEKIVIEILNILSEHFGYTVNENGYKVLPPYIGVIQGDGIELESISRIIDELDSHKISLENVVFGMGGKLVNPPKGRDAYSFAMKATSQVLEDGTEEDLFKDPITDIGKRSLRGQVTTFRCTSTGKIFNERVSLQEVNPFIEDMMVEVYHNGVVSNMDSFETIVERANAEFK